MAAPTEFWGSMHAVNKFSYPLVYCDLSKLYFRGGIEAWRLPALVRQETSVANCGNERSAQAHSYSRLGNSVVGRGGGVSWGFPSLMRPAIHFRSWSCSYNNNADMRNLLDWPAGTRPALADLGSMIERRFWSDMDHFSLVTRCYWTIFFEVIPVSESDVGNFFSWETS